MPDTSAPRAPLTARPDPSALPIVLALLAALLVLPAPARAASLVEVTGFGSNPGNLRMFKYIPDSPPANMPLVVAMHGCTQSASSYDNESGWTKIADTYKVALVLPQQQSANNGSQCFNWFQPGDYARGAGEALSIKQMVDNVKANHSINAAKVSVTGLSSGGAMTAVMLATYPDVFSGGAIVAGIPYKCASTSSEGFNCMSPGKNLTPQQWGDLVRGAFPSWTGPWPVVSVWHGTSDFTVASMNLTESMEQWTNVHGIDQTADVSDTVKGYPHKVYKNTSGVAKVETYSITSMGHGQPLDPGTATDQCGVAGAYMLDVNICAAYFVSQWLGIVGGGGGGGGNNATLSNQDANDGYVKAFSDGSSAAVGTLENTYGLAIGRGTDGKFNRTVLSFDTSSIPDGATITRAYVTVLLNSYSGDPWANPAGNTLVIDVKTGCFGACTIETGDWASAASASAVASIARWTTGSKQSADFSSSGRSAISKTGTTQLKLRFSLNQTATNYIFVDNGASATLFVEWA